MYNVELRNVTTGKVINNRQVRTQVEASDIAQAYIEQAKETGEVTYRSLYQVSYRGYILGQTIITTAGTFEISTAKTK